MSSSFLLVTKSPSQIRTSIMLREKGKSDLGVEAGRGEEQLRPHPVHCKIMRPYEKQPQREEKPILFHIPLFQ